MLKKENRLTSNSDFSKVYKLGKKIRGDFINIYYLKPSDYEGAPKFGFVVPNKFNKVAPKRNRTKRVLREIVRLNLNNIKKGYWIVIKPEKKIESKKYEEISLEFNKILSKTPFLKESRD